MTNPTIDDVFSKLDEWRHFPAYQLERRADIYFTLFLPLVLQGHFKLKSEPKLIPEFPLRHGTLGTDAESTGSGKIGKDQSVKVDYVAVSRDTRRVFLVELKTDMASKSPKQDKYLQKASKKTFKELLDGVRQIKNVTTQKQKYKALLNNLKDTGVDELRKSLKPEVVYVQPREDDDAPSHSDPASYIYFAGFAKAIKGRGEIADRFAESLEKWQESPQKSP